MKLTEISLDVETVPRSIRQYLKGATVYDSSGDNAKTFLISGADRVFLKISPKGSLERQYQMTEFLHHHQVAPKAVAYETDLYNDYLITEAVDGEDGTAAIHIENPRKLACVFGEYLRMLHSLPINNCPYENRKSEMLQEATAKGIDLSVLNEYPYPAADNVLIHGDYCLPNIIMDHFSFKGFIDLGYGGVGDRHYDLYWGIWTLHYNLKTDNYRDLFLDAYGRSDVDEAGLRYFATLAKMID